MDELRLIRQQEQTAGILVESTDARDRRIPSPPAFRQQRVDVRTLARVVRANEPDRLVEEKQQAIGTIERFTVYENVRRQRLCGNVIGWLPLYGDTFICDPRSGFAPATIAEAGEELIEAAHGRFDLL